jgi:cyclopropane fatty-acyl-phospholipid synthase-like methyltransferase
MRLDLLFYRLAYRFGKPRWDTAEPRPELAALVHDRPPARALDLGCGTGASVLYLASRGWDAVGVDFAPEAIAAARDLAERAGVSATFVLGDVSRLDEAGVRGPFGLLLDIGCYHAVPADRRDAYAAGVAAAARPGADFYLAGISDPPWSWRLLGAGGVTGEEIRQRFGPAFDLAGQQQLGSRFVAYHLVRTTTPGGSADVADRVRHVGWGRQSAARAGDRQGA